MADEKTPQQQTTARTTEQRTKAEVVPEPQVTGYVDTDDKEGHQEGGYEDDVVYEDASGYRHAKRHPAPGEKVTNPKAIFPEDLKEEDK